MKTCRIPYENACCTGFRNLSINYCSKVKFQFQQMHISDSMQKNPQLKKEIVAYGIKRRIA